MNKITKKDKMLEICEFLDIKIASMFKYQNRNKKSPTGKINKLGFRLLMNADLDTLKFFLNDNNFTQDYFLADISHCGFLFLIIYINAPRRVIYLCRH